MSTTNSSIMTSNSIMTDNSTMNIDKKKFDICLSAANILNHYRIIFSNLFRNKSF